MPAPHLAYVGGYTTPDRNGTAPGITVWRTGTNPGDAWTRLNTVDAGENPSFLRFGPPRADGGNRVLYAAHGGRTTVSAWTVDNTGALTPAGREPAGGTNPVDLAVWPGRDALLVANYTAGTVAVLPLAPDGGLRPPASTLALTRPNHPGPSMPHGIAFDPTGTVAMVPDKGLDCIHLFTLGPDLSLHQAAPGLSEPGTGPRHCVVHPTLPVVYVVNELSCSVNVYQWGDNALHPTQSVPNVPPGTSGLAAEIAVAPGGHAVYASTRGDDTIAHFAIQPGTGLLSPPRRTPCGGAEPRFFTLSPDGATLFVCCQNDARIVAFPLAPDGTLGTPATVAEVESPTALVFLPTAPS